MVNFFATGEKHLMIFLIIFVVLKNYAYMSMSSFGLIISLKISFKFERLSELSNLNNMLLMFCMCGQEWVSICN